MSTHAGSLLPTVLLVYDHFLTLGAEVAYIWRPGHERASAWFLVMRYFSLCANIAMACLMFIDFTPEVRCSKFLVAHGLRILIVLQEIALILTCLVIAGITTISVAAWSVIPDGPSPPVRTTLPGCPASQSRSQALRLAGAWEAEFACDVLVLGLTLYRALQKNVQGSATSGMLWRVMTRDAAMYFSVICLVNLANLLIFYYGDIYTTGCLAWFTAQLSVAMISRLMLNLHSAADPDCDSTIDPTYLGTLRFASRMPTTAEQYELRDAELAGSTDLGDRG
ncbi:hypothetical protein C8R44DRAFT_321098 [Mycena epipterygia]|nr:hypothetical protein C8R44DRAFT_321098 [Mycena epipterygia]